MSSGFMFASVNGASFDDVVVGIREPGDRADLVPIALLHDMRELVRQEPLAALRLRRKATVREDDVPARGMCERLNRTGRRSGRASVCTRTRPKSNPKRVSMSARVSGSR